MSDNSSRRDEERDEPVSAPHETPTPRRLAVAEIMGGQREAILEHQGQDYRLRITANGKLILPK